MNTITTKDRPQVYFKDWGAGQFVVLGHGWPLSTDDWDAQMMLILNHWHSVITRDGRRYGRSAQVAIPPSMAETEGTHAAGIENSDMQKQVRSQTPLGRLGKPGDIASTAVFLASADSSWISGETFVIAGGLR